MKIAVSVDDILVRDSASDILDIILDTFEEADIYTFVHRPYQVLGPVDLRKVHSTYLTHVASNPEKLRRMSFLTPMAAKNFQIPCTYDLIINLSRGLSHGIPRCEGTQQLTYFYDAKNLPGQRSWREKFFGPYVLDWSLSSLGEVDNIWFSSQTLKEDILSSLSQKDSKGKQLIKEAKVVRPFFNVAEFPPGPSNVYQHEHFLINTEGLTISLAKELMGFFASRQCPYRFVGPDEHLNSLKSEEKEKVFLGDRCGGELAPLLAACKALIDIGDSQQAFPQMALQCLSSGRPVIALGDDLRKEFLPLEGTYFLNTSTFDWGAFYVEFERLIDEGQNFDPQKLHNLVKKFHQAGLRGELKRHLQNVENVTANAHSSKGLS